jgi:hypothetical protein
MGCVCNQTRPIRVSTRALPKAAEKGTGPLSNVSKLIDNNLVISMGNLSPRSKSTQRTGKLSNRELSMLPFIPDRHQ